ncbi:mitochondrial coenzyme A diphosphatase NUDT8-like [Palaemon carinicauda]|uniref:mitochondrial coenzyme A diphosphatase NUDT8-like n=1 Tax=Palaemon carinicauda TaxID=392227 RepID=UPI0035B6742C
MAKHLAQLLIAGVQVVGRAFAKALRQEIAASQAAAQRAGGGAAGAKHSATNQKLGMSLEEAKQIINVEELDVEKIKKNFDYLFSVNDRKQGGSFYIQSKICGRRSCERRFCSDTWQISPNRLWPEIPAMVNPFFRGPVRHFSSNTFSWDSVLSESSRKKCVERLQHAGALRKFQREPKRYAAVLIPLCHFEGELSLLFTVRSATLSKHAREVGFPGGMADPGEDPIDTALRETEEEIGIPRTDVDIWGVTPVVPGRDQQGIRGVLAYIGHVDQQNLKLSENEVDYVFAVSLQNLCDPQHARQTQFRSKQMKGGGYALPVFTGSNPRIWGLTAILIHMTLRALLPKVYKNNLTYLPPLLK